MEQPSVNRDNWGWRARIGMFIVSNEAVPEAEWWAMMPPDISVHAARVNASAPWASWQDTNPKSVLLAKDVARGAQQFAAMRLNAVVLGHSSSSILGGAGWDEAVVQALGELLPRQVNITTNGLDCIAALNASGVERPFLVFPPWFGESFLVPGEDYFATRGFLPVGSIRIDPGARWRDVPPEQLYPQGMGFEQDVVSLYEQICQACPIDADGVLIAGTGFRCVGIAQALETALNRPVITANQASLWHCLRLSGLDSAVAGYGNLFTLATT